MQEVVSAKYVKNWRTHPLLAGADDTVLDRLLRRDPPCVTVREYAAGETVFSRKQYLRELGFVLKGSVTVDRVTEHGGMRMSELGEGDVFGAAALYVEQGEFVAEITARTVTRILFVTEDAWTQLLLSSPEALRSYLAYLGGRLRYLNKRLDALSQDTMEDRLFLYMKGKAENGVYMIKNHSRLADELCVGRATLYRAMDSLCGQGRVLKDGNAVFILE